MKEFCQAKNGYFYSFKYPLALTSVGLIGALVVGCSEGKVTQCNRLIEIANQAASNVETATQNSSPDEPTAFLQIADMADDAATQLETLELEDETLRDFRQRFIELYEETSSATRELVEAVEAQNLSEAEAAYTRLEEATNQEGPLVEEVNAYCGGNL